VGEVRGFGAAAVVALPFAGTAAVLAVVAAPSASEWRAADPLLQLLGGGAVWLAVAAAAVVALAWARVGRVRRGDLIRAAAGAGLAVLALLCLRGLVGGRLPSVIPREESSAPGLTLGLSAGLLEEVVFRLVVLPGVYLACRRKLGVRASAALGIVATALLFSLSHELGPAGGAFEPRFLLTRFLVPGVAMSVLAFSAGPAFVVAAHCSAHLVIPALFHA